ncbi:NAD(P)-binding protein [Metschnikowia bicuspidata]|uniref:NAD(P)-binding protein n=1 Tax=Metschnikowia bicuspidata TaxID=27322 RepID=A0A4P9ZG25_9ASCO|nr:NAD(P)-binding protein [Metschnikowia bicuspidata]
MVHYLLDRYPDCKVTCIDRLNYASYLLENLRDVMALPRFTFHQEDLAAGPGSLPVLLAELIQTRILHFAAASCVDRSFVQPAFFMQNNVGAVETVLDAYRLYVDVHPLDASRILIVHISTDEVYGVQFSGSVDDSAALQRTNPYAASKTAYDVLVAAYTKSYGLRTAVVRAKNIYGPLQYLEKLIPVTLDALRHVGSDGVLPEAHRVRIHGDGTNRRSYLHMSDFVRAVDLVRTHTLCLDSFGDIFNVGVTQEIANWALRAEIDEAHFVYSVRDRPYNDA